MKKTNKFVLFKEGKIPSGLLHDKYKIKKIENDLYILAGDVELNKDLENIDYTVEETAKEGWNKRD